MEKIIHIKRAISADLSLRNRADLFFDSLEHESSKAFVIDFSDVRSISRSFAHEYLERKKISSKQIREINVTDNVVKMFKVVLNANKKDRLVSSSSTAILEI